MLKKAHELGTFPGIDVAIIIRKQGQYSTYTSTSQESFPPTIAEIISRASIRLMYLTNVYTIQKISWPVPKILLPCDFEKEDHQAET